MMVSFVDADGILVFGSVFLAFGFGWVVGIALFREWRGVNARRRLALAAGLRADAPSSATEEAHERVIRYVANVSRRLTLGASRSLVPVRISCRAHSWFARHGKKAGLSSSFVTAEGLVEAGLRLGIVCSACGVLLGACFSSACAVLGMGFGMVFGLFVPFRAVLACQRMRSLSVERELSEMLDVVALALRSGLSFDRGFQLYCQHFHTSFSRSCEAARRTWTYGLDSRESALRSLADSYDSPQLERAVQSIVRSLRFGTALSEVMEGIAFDARQDHRSHVQERVAKAPVKMMIPIGTLILPAMLLLVLGPVLLELMVGF